MKSKKLKKQLKDCQDNKNDDNNFVITSYEEVPKFITKVLSPAIPYSARLETMKERKVKINDTNAFIINNDDEISDTIPSTILLKRKEQDGLILKIMQEVLMTNFWNGDAKNYGLYSAWAMNTLDYYGEFGNWRENYRLVPKSTIKDCDKRTIILTKMLFNSNNQLYIDELFNLIEKYLQKHGVNCEIEKSFVSANNRIWGSKKVFVSHGSLPFPKVKLNDNQYPNALYYYCQINFDIKMKSNGKVYAIRGYTILLSDSLKLYKVIDSPYEDDYDILNEFNKN